MKELKNKLVKEWFSINEKTVGTPKDIIYLEPSKADSAVSGIAWDYLDGGFQLDGPGQFIQYVRIDLVLDLIKKLEESNNE